MKTIISTRLISLGARGGSFRSALLISCGLHLLLALALATVLPRLRRAGVTAPSIIVVDLVGLGGAFERSGDRSQADALVAPEPAPAGRRDAPAAEPPLEAPAVAADEPDAEPSSDAPAIAATEAESLPEPVAATGPLTPAAPAPLDPALPAVPETPAATVALETPVPPLDAEASPAVVTTSPEALLRPVAKAAMPDDERRMLERRVAEWVTALDGLADDALTWRHRGQDYRARVVRTRANDSMGIERVVVAVTTDRDGGRWSTEVELKRLAFSSFAQFVDRWDPSVQIHDDEIDGRFHSNSEIFVANSGTVQPAFRGKVTTAAGINTSQSKRRVRADEVFLGGLETRVRKIALPRRFVPFTSADEIDADRRQRFRGDTRLRFAADGSVTWQALDTDDRGRAELGDRPYYLIGVDDATLHVSGTVNGTVLIVADDDIVIDGDLVYASHPARDTAADDYLGLVAAGSVVIAAPDTTGPGDLDVHAAVYAKRRFVVSDHGARSDPPATLHVYGSVAAGAVTATEPRFRTRLEFDPRLEDRRPPRFPMTDRYELVAWDGLWSPE